MGYIKALLFSAAFTVLFSYCNLAPHACAELDEMYEVGRQYTLTSCSDNHEFVTWEFGDGTGFLGETAIKTFDRRGDFKISVKAYANGAYYHDETTSDIKAVVRVLDRFTVIGNSVFQSFRLTNNVNNFDFVEIYANAEGLFTEDEPYAQNLEADMRNILPVGGSNFSLVGIRSNGQSVDLIELTTIDFESNLDNPIQLTGKGFELNLYWVYE